MQRLKRSPLLPAKRLLADPLLRGVTAFGSAEIANRGVRLITTIIIARQLAPNIVGEAALALSIFEIVRVLGGVGVGQRIIKADPAELQAVCNTAQRIFWIWAALLALTQIGVALVLWLVFAQPMPAAMLALLSGVFLIMPPGLVHCYLAMRESRNAALARTAATQAVADHVLTALLLLANPSPWSIILPKLLTAPIWLMMTRRNRPWQPAPESGFAPWRGIVRYGSGVLVSDALSALRQQGDNLLIAALMGSSALGAYYFAYNAGLGIVTSLVNSFGTVSFPLLCAARPGAARYIALRKIVLAGFAIFGPLIAAQSVLAPVYVPLIFGAHWAFASPLISILCLAGFSQLASALTANWLRAEGRVAHDARRSFISCLCALGGLYLGSRTGSLHGAVIGLVAGSLFAAAITAISILATPLRGHPLPPCTKEQMS